MIQAGQLTERQLHEGDHFDQWADLNNIDLDHFSKPEFGPWNPYWCVFDLVRRQNCRPEQRLLSFGCGRGANALRYARLGYDVHGFDISPKRIETATRLAAHYNLSGTTHFSVQSAERLDYPAAYFDIVVGENILHHVDIQKATSEVARVLKPGGTAIFKEPLATPTRDRIRQSAPIRWLLPVGVKNVRRNAWYHHPPDTVKLTRKHLSDLGQLFADVQVHRFRVLGIFNMFTRSRTTLEKCDRILFKLLPPARRFGDMAVIVVKKSELR
jgi:2-polyprenyl-3-methyl-5-hydroxy-6-metoxy-1,4-benzoquinol methylase